MSSTLLVKHVRPAGGQPVDVLVQEGRITAMRPDITVEDDGVRVLDGDNQLLLPGLVDAHAHVDKNLLGRPWRKNEVQGSRILDYVENERRLRRDLDLQAGEQAARQLRLAIAAGITHIRSHVDVDTEADLAHLEGVMATREAFADQITMQLVAFPQSGMLVRPGTVDLLEEALKLGAQCLGGLDPSTMDRDPVRHLDTIFALADRYGVELDIHLHEPGMLGAFAVELIAERTRALGLQGRVTISHVFCLGMLDDAYLDRLIDLLLQNQINIMSLGSGSSPFPPIRRLYEAGVSLCTGTDGVRDTWSPLNRVDLFDRIRLLSYRCGFRRDEEIEMLLQIATYGGARVMRQDDYGLAPGKSADFLVVRGDTPSEAIVDQPPRTYVVKSGQLMAAGGCYLGGQ